MENQRMLLFLITLFTHSFVDQPEGKFAPTDADGRRTPQIMWRDLSLVCGSFFGNILVLHYKQVFWGLNVVTEWPCF